MHIQILTIAAALTVTATPATAQSSSFLTPALSYDAQEAQLQYVHHRRGHHRGYNGRVWRDDRGRYRCRREDGTVGLLIGGAAGALLGREIDGGRDRTVGTVVGAAAGALIGREIDRSDSRCE